MLTKPWWRVCHFSMSMTRHWSKCGHLKQCPERNTWYKNLKRGPDAPQGKGLEQWKEPWPWDGDLHPTSCSFRDQLCDLGQVSELSSLQQRHGVSLVWIAPFSFFFFLSPPPQLWSCLWRVEVSGRGTEPAPQQRPKPQQCQHQIFHLLLLSFKSP